MLLFQIFRYIQLSVILHISQAYRVDYGYSSSPDEIISGACTVRQKSSPDYDYNMYSVRGPPLWPRLFRCCGGRRQSPVNLFPRRSLCDQPYTLRFSSSRSTTLTGDIHNNGHTAKVKFDKKRSVRLLNVPRRPGNSFRLAEVHYHAGYVQGMGSEHLVDGQGFDGEIHLVHYNTKYSSVEDAQSKNDGLAIVSVFIQESNSSSHGELGKLAQRVSCLNGKGKDVKLPVKLRPLQFIPRKRSFYIYEGSLTAPPCSESVLWFVMAEPLELSSLKINRLRHLQYKDGSLLSTFSNVRPIQDLNYRLVETNMPCRYTSNSLTSSYA